MALSYVVLVLEITELNIIVNVLLNTNQSFIIHLEGSLEYENRI